MQLNFVFFNNIRIKYLNYVLNQKKFLLRLKSNISITFGLNFQQHSKFNILMRFIKNLFNEI